MDCNGTWWRIKKIYVGGINLMANFPSEVLLSNYRYIQRVTTDIPDGFHIYRVRPWSDPIMYNDGYSAFLRGNIGQFQVVSPYIFNDAGEWCNTLSSNSNFSVLRRADVFKLANHQLLDFDYEWGLSEQKIISLLNVKLPDGYTLKQKMAYIIWGNNLWGAQMRCQGDWWDYLKRDDGTYILDRDGKKQDVLVQMIAIVHGGQKILASDKTKEFQGIKMRQMVNFRRSDFGKHYNTHPYLMQRVTVASTPNNVYGEDPKGKVYCPVALSGVDFDFTGNFQPAADGYWLPDKYLIRLS